MNSIQPSGCPFNHGNLKKPADASQAPAAPVDERDPAGLAEKLHDERAAVIPCPFWRTAINENMVTVAPDGTVSMDDVGKLLKTAGVGFGLRNAALLGIKKVAAEMAGSQGGLAGFWATLQADRLNVLDLPKSSLMHTGDSGILRDGFHAEKLEELLSFSSDGKTVSLQDLAEANKHQVANDPGESGHRFGVAEYSIILEVFGRSNEDGDKFLTKDDLVRLFRDNKLPEGWQKDSVGFVDLGSTIFHMFGEQKDDSKSESLQSLGGGEVKSVSKSCPFLNGKTFTAEETAAQHPPVQAQK